LNRFDLVLVQGEKPILEQEHAEDAEGRGIHVRKTNASRLMRSAKSKFLPDCRRHVKLHHVQPIARGFPMEHISFREFRRNAASVIRKVGQGQRIIMTYRGKPVMRLEPIGSDIPDADDPFYKITELAVSTDCRWPMKRSTKSPTTANTPLDPIARPPESMRRRSEGLGQRARFFVP
jgi:prevent-host-death family protein